MNVESHDGPAVQPTKDTEPAGPALQSGLPSGPLETDTVPEAAVQTRVEGVDGPHAASVPEDDGPPPANGGPWYHLTNRFNLLVILGSRLVQPRDAYRKYYTDLLDAAPGAVPLLDHPPGRALLEHVSVDAGAFPVLIELESAPSAPGVTVSGGYLVHGAVPLTAVSAIHFKDERAMREHQARGYANIAPHEKLLRVSPDLFDGDGSIDAAFLSALRDGGAVETDVDFARADRIRGAISAAVKAASTARGLDIAARLLGGDAVSDDAPWITAANVRLDGPPVVDPSSVEDVLFVSAIETMIAADVQDTWRPRAVLDQVRERSLQSADDAAREVIDRNLAHVRAVLTGGKEFAPFKSTGSGLATAKSLLLVLLRERLGSLLQWPEQETGADDVVRMTAAVLAGALRGISREDMGVRDVRLDDLTATWVASGVRQVAVREKTDDQEVLRVGADVIASVEAPAPTARAVFDQVPQSARKPTLLEICRGRGWSDLVLTRVVLERSAAVEVHDGRLVVTGYGTSVSHEIDEDSVLDRLDDEGLPADALMKVFGLRKRGVRR